MLTGLGLIVAIGAQNAYVLRQGIARQHIGTVVAICALSDALLIVLGVAGVGALIADHPTALTVCKWLGAAYLVWFAIKSFRAARHPQALRESAAPARGGVILTTLALTYLNPHVYLDTVLMLGNIANQHGAVGRWWFAGGAAFGSLVWFSGLGFGARGLAPLMHRPSTWRVLDILIGCTMLLVAVLLLRS
ncbi:amino acid transporter [Calidifontibacter sp. DB0510]|uniref:Amino acid transporter n=1 Tax=Metallococcus carri TaxID=1656884 RepID=A0A967AYT2_9MICO|nr:LysE/ArgO family amino acid transporter [Metallococcus carri]NHN55559.1 amino acid transporter [Metallococcus carri]NOP38257.1 amino acid transporter [Calidifontibacter sp. DB2511S]